MPEQDHAVHEEEEQQEQAMEDDSSSSSLLTTVFKLAAASAFLYSAVSTISSSSSSSNQMGGGRRQLSAVGDTRPSYMDPLFKDLRERKKLFEDTPPEEVKYWFEYAGALQVS